MQEARCNLRAPQVRPDARGRLLSGSVISLLLGAAHVLTQLEELTHLQNGVVIPRKQVPSGEKQTEGNSFPEFSHRHKHFTLLWMLRAL